MRRAFSKISVYFRLHGLLSVFPNAKPPFRQEEQPGGRKTTEEVLRAEAGYAGFGESVKARTCRVWGPPERGSGGTRGGPRAGIRCGQIDSVFRASISSQPRSLRMAYSMVTKTTTNTDATAISTPPQGI